MGKTSPYFNGLLVELRLEIWKLTSFIPRGVDISISERSGSEGHHISHLIRSFSPPPAILQVCCESRAEALKHYILDFGATEDAVDFIAKIYINPAVDAVCFLRPDAFMLYLTVDNDDDDETEDEKANFVSQLEIIHLKSPTLNLYNWGHEAIYDVIVDVDILCYGDILPVQRDAFEELILFSDSRCHNYGGGNEI